MDTTVAKRTDEGITRSGGTRIRITIRIGHIYSILLLLLAFVSALLVLRHPTPPPLGGLMQTFLCVGLVGSMAFTVIRELAARVLKLEDELDKLKQELPTVRQSPNDRNG